MILCWLLLSFFRAYGSDDISLDLSSAVCAFSTVHVDPSEEDIAESIINGFFQENGHIIRPKVKPVLTEHIRRESQEIKIVLAKATISHTPLSHSNGDTISTKILQLFGDALDEVMEIEEEKNRSRCTRFTTLLVAGGIGVAGTTLGALISALVTVNIQDC